MNEEILEITKKFHDTYEKLASEYTYETRKDTKVFDINSNNGKLMYATVNEIVSPILKENQKYKEVINKAIEYIKEKYDYILGDDTFLDHDEIIDRKQIIHILELLGDKEVSE